jgi:hypothetical protein
MAQAPRNEKTRQKQPVLPVTTGKCPAGTPAITGSYTHQARKPADFHSFFHSCGKLPLKAASLAGPGIYHSHSSRTTTENGAAGGMLRSGFLPVVLTLVGESNEAHVSA